MDGGDLAEPVEIFFEEIGDGDEFEGDGEIEEGEPATDGGGDFAAHEAAADDTDFESFQERETGEILG